MKGSHIAACVGTKRCFQETRKPNYGINPLLQCLGELLHDQDWLKILMAAMNVPLL